MSQENVDLLAVAGQAFNTRDLDTFLSLMHPDIEWDAGVLGTPIYRGMEGVREMLADVETSWTGFRIEFLGQPIGSGDALVARCRLSARGRDTGVPVEAIQYMAVAMADGRARRVAFFGSQPEALDAVGLRE
jgi:ketosteroid isomerase-like protein